MTWKQYTIFDENGKVMMSNLSRMKRLQGNFICVYSVKFREFLQKCPNFSTMKVFLYLLTKMTFSPYVACTQDSIAKAFKMIPATVSKAFKFLKEGEYIREAIIDGTKCYMVNPEISIRGLRSREDKLKEWNALGGYYNEEESGISEKITILPAQSEIVTIEGS